MHMDIGTLLNRAWNIVWNNKWLILLGMVAILGMGGGSGPQGGTDFNFDRGAPPEHEQRPEDFGDFSSNAELATFMALAIPVALGLVCIALTFAFVIWAISRIAAGGLIAGVEQIEA